MHPGNCLRFPIRPQRNLSSRPSRQRAPRERREEKFENPKSRESASWRKGWIIMESFSRASLSLSLCGFPRGPRRNNIQGAVLDLPIVRSLIRHWGEREEWEKRPLLKYYNIAPPGVPPRPGVYYARINITMSAIIAL